MNPLLIVLFVALAIAAIVITFVVMARASKGYDQAKRRRVEAGPTIPCSTCKSWMTYTGLQDLSVPTAGPEGSELGVDTGAGVWTVEVYRCPTCRKVELFLPPAAG